MSRPTRQPRKAPPPPPVRGERRRKNGETYVLYNTQMPPSVRDFIVASAPASGLTGSDFLLEFLYRSHPQLRPPRRRPRARRKAEP